MQLLVFVQVDMKYWAQVLSNISPKTYVLPYCFGKNILLFSILTHVLRVQLNQGVLPKAETRSTR